MTDFFYGLIKGLSPALQWVLFILATVAGFLYLIKFADIFVDSASNLAKLCKIPTIVIGLTIVAFGTSAPEMSISVTAAASGSAGISVGNIIGSNIFNLFLILAVAALIAPVTIKRHVVKRDVLTMTISSLLMVLFAFLFSTSGGYQLVWYEGLIFLVLFLIYIVFMIRGELKRSKKEFTEIKEQLAPKPVEQEVVLQEETPSKAKSIWKAIILIIVSLAGIVVGGTLVNVGAKGIVINMGATETLAGLTVCAIGTSLPELITTIVAMKKNESDLAVGNIVGSNIFNLMLILGLCSTITPLTLDSFALADVVIMAVLVVVFFIYALFNERLGKKMAIAMISVYALYFAFIIVREYVPIL